MYHAHVYIYIYCLTTIIHYYTIKVRGQLTVAGRLLPRPHPLSGAAPGDSESTTLKLMNSLPGIVLSMPDMQ